MASKQASPPKQQPAQVIPSQPHSEEEQDDIANKYKSLPIVVRTTPDVDITTVAMEKYHELKQNYNFVSFEDAETHKKTILTGIIQPFAMPNFDFNQEFVSFQKNGYTSNPNTNFKGLLFNEEKHPEFKKLVDNLGEEIGEDHPDLLHKMYAQTSKKVKTEKAKLIKSKREKDGEGLAYAGPWAGYGECLINTGLTEQQKQALVKAEERRKQKIQEAKKEEEKFEPISTFHLTHFFDYKGKSYLEPPTDFKIKRDICYIPKKQVHTYIGSNIEGYQVIKFFPRVGHYFLLGNAEGHVKLFDVNKNRDLVRTYVGHTKAIRDVEFTNDGKHFLSCSFDRTIHYWDTEYGKVSSTFKLKKYPFCLRFNSQFDKQNIFLVGSSSKKVSQFDVRTGNKVLQYDQHLGTVNTITWIEDRKFVTSSDDKKLFVWEFGIPVVYKHVSEPEMHAVTAATMHPNGEYYAGQSSDNQIAIYESKAGNFRRNRTKKFASHSCAGYACGISFSPDGQFLASGDERGRLFFYDWKTAKNYRTLDAHSGVCIGVQWHPNEQTQVLTSGWEGLVKLWQ